MFLKIVMCGESGVGKTNIISRYTKNEFLEGSRSTIGAEFATRTIEYSGKTAAGKNLKRTIKLQIWDTAGQERYRAITRSYYRDVSGCLLAYSVGSKKSFERLQNWVEEIRQNANTDPIIGIVANKCDLEPAKQKVTIEEAKEYAQQARCAFAIETSAKTGQGVEEAFNELIRQFIDGGQANEEEQKISSSGSNVKIDGQSTDKKKKDCC